MGILTSSRELTNFEVLHIYHIIEHQFIIHTYLQHMYDPGLILPIGVDPTGE